LRRHSGAPQRGEPGIHNHKLLLTGETSPRAMALLFDNPYRAARRVIDISGDGSNNRGRSVNQARDEAVARGVGINGLPILALEPDLDRYYRENVIGGPGAFVIAAKDFETFGEAILKKLIAEIANLPPEPSVPRAFASAR
jgi:hypothetical protein